MPEVFDANLLIELLKEDSVRGIYRPDKTNEEDVLKVAYVKVTGVGTGYLLAQTAKYFPLPYEIGDVLVVFDKSWITYDWDDVEYCVIRCDKVISRVSKSKTPKPSILPFSVKE